MPEQSTKTTEKKDKLDIEYGHLNDSIGYLVRRAQIKIFRDFDRHFEALEVKPAQFSALEIIHQNPGLRQSALAQALGIQRTNMVGMLDTLQERGLVDRQLSKQDRRSHALHLTRKGEQLLKHLYAQFNLHESILSETIGESNVKTFKQCLVKIAQRLEPE